MQTLTDHLAHDHARCDGLFASAEEAAAAGDWPQAAVLLTRFADALEAHFHAEETVLFPAFEAATGSSAGPTQVMRTEHQQMRRLLDSMRSALASRDADGFLGQGESLLILMQQHNLKEENILYPMADRTLAASAADLISRMPLGEGRAQ